MVNAASHAHDVALVARLPAVPTILRVITDLTGLRLSLVARVTDTDWTACAVRDTMSFGLKPGDQLELATTLCNEVRAARKPIVISNASHDTTYCTHPTPRLYQFESYLAVPIFRTTGEYFGNVCALDSEPRSLDDGRALATVQLFADLVALQLEAEERNEQLRADLADARASVQLREQFAAVLSHELRNPLGSILAGTEVLRARSLPESERRVVERMGRSARRLRSLVAEVLDFARGRLGNGIPVAPHSIADLAAVLEHAVEELRAAHPERTVRFTASGADELFGDAQRLQQLVSNLVSNALEHGDPGEPVEVAVNGDRTQVVVRVTNGGPMIPPDVLPTLFKPFVRGVPERPAGRGLGLGLFIAEQIARAHGGAMHAQSDAQRTVFACTLPRR